MISDIIKDRAELVNREIRRILSTGEPDGLYRAARHYLSAGDRKSVV